MPPPNDDLDVRMMAVALEMAERGLGTTAPNPAVGAVIVDETRQEIIAEGWTQPGGRPHAETQAIERAGERSRGATIYVTLEPCSHYGKTPPCAEAIVKAGIKRAVVAILDPDPRVSGRGMRLLREAGLVVKRGVLADRAHRVTRGHILRVTERRPLVQLKLALGSNGEVPRGAGGKPVWVTGPEARAHGHLLRARADAIMVGGGTVMDDDPELTCRLPGMEDRSPIRVVLAGARLPSLDSKLVRTARQTPVWIIAGANTDATALAALSEKGCRILPVTTMNGRPWLPAVCEVLVAEGITRLLVEGGPTLWRAFLLAGLVDEIYCYRAENGVPGSAADAARRDIDSLQPAHAFGPAEVRQVGTDGLYVFHRK
jgi:diaminohydroxyphosphoribosylaminopyrimidine deaminase/5-amino-6-(5-phosphoribosylamino)uracil reductase